MSNRLSFDIDMNASGYIKGAQESSKATKDLKSATEQYLSDFGSLRKQMNAAKKEALDLAGQFAMLGEAEKNSEHGKELADNLQLAIEKAAELKDVYKDTVDAINNAASDTAGLDALKEVFDIGKEAMTAYVGVVGRLTGSEKELKNVVSSLAAVQGTFNAVIKTTNALQKNSATMIALQRSGVLSLAQAERISTAATKASTVAIKGLGAAMKALPYVAVAAGVLALGKAFVNYMSGVNKATKETANTKKELTELQKSIKDISNTFINQYTTALGTTISKYEALKRQYTSLTSRKDQIEWFKAHKKECESLNIGINNLVDADRVFMRESEKVVEILRTRALMTAEAARNAELYAKMMKEIDSANANVVKFNAGEKVLGSDIDRYGLEKGKDYTQDESKIGAYVLTDEGARKASTEAAKRNIQTHTSEISEELERSNTRLDELAKKMQGFIGTSLENEGNNSHDVKIKVNPELDFTQWNNALNKQFKEYDKRLKDKLKTFNDKYNAETTKIKVYLDAQLSSPQNIQRALNEISNAMTIKPKLDFEIPENMREEIGRQKETLDGLFEALSIAENKKIQFAKAGDTAGVTTMTEQIQQLTTAIEENSQSLDKNIKKAKNIASISEGFKQAGQAVGAFGDMFSALGEATDDAGLKVMGIIAQAIATIALSFAQALASCKTWIDWLIFGVTGMTTMITMISQIKNLTAGGYAEGGVVPGNSFTGDKLIARVNSGERILTAKQNENLEKIANTNYHGYQQAQNLAISSIKVQGRDLVLAIRNELKTTRQKL